MKRKLKIRFLLIAAFAVMATAAISIVLCYRILVHEIYDDLKVDAHLVMFAQTAELSEELKEHLTEDGIRVTVTAEDGTVLYDSTQMPERMEKHDLRPEIAQAEEAGEGYSIRRSATSAKHTFYYAVRLSDNQILRVARESGSIYHLRWNMLCMLVFMGVLVFAVCAVFAKRMTQHIVEPIEKMAMNSVLMDEREVYEEIRPFIVTIRQQHMDILDHARLRQEFTANVSHELKTPLTAISGYAELLVSGMTNEQDARHFAGEIQRSAERLKTLIDDIIKLSELDDESLRLEFETVNLYEIAEKCMAQMELWAQKNEISMQLFGKPAAVNGNRMLMEELLYNLCSNAVRYNKRGGCVTITVGEEEGHPVVSVRDTGIGIPKDQQERVFERFYRVDKSRSKMTGGTGLGLAIVKHIAVRHDARIELSSEVGAGTEVKVIF